ncbi:hypothetical protein EV368DRAFT_89844 [Lentinula lateritia]|nr:hypothetical protein EV368DRAFT_89844 [Lentinula lateritia]
MLDDRDTQAVDRQELECFQWAQEQEAVLAAKHKCACASPPRDRLTKKRQSTKARSQPGTSGVAVGEVPRVVQLVFPPARPAPQPLSPSPPHPSSLNLVFASRIMPVSRQTGSVRDPESLVQLAEVAGRQTGLGMGNAARFAVPAPSAIKDPQEDTSPLSMPPANCPALVPRTLRGSWSCFTVPTLSWIIVPGLVKIIAGWRYFRSSSGKLPPVLIVPATVPTRLGVFPFVGTFGIIITWSS